MNYIVICGLGDVFALIEFNFDYFEQVDSVNIDSQLGNTGFGSSFAFISVVASLVIVLLGIIVYFSGYLG